MRLKLTMTSIFTIYDRAAFRGTFRIEANQKSKGNFIVASQLVEQAEGFKL